MVPLKKYSIGSFNVIGFDIIHDTNEPFGFVISHEEMGVCMFLTDSVFSPIRVKNVTHFLVESNYDDDILNEKGGDNQFLIDRIRQSHMSIQTLEKMLEANDLSKTRTITLTHLSDRNSNQYTAKKRIEDAFGKETYIAESGMEINYNKRPF